MSRLYEFESTNIDGQKVPLKDYENKLVLVVNVASACGLTPHYEGLQSLYHEYKDQGLEILGFPCNQFGAQEPGSEEEIKTFCTTKFNVTFPMFAKIDVNGPETAPLYKWLKEEQAGSEGAEIEWNFAKFLIDKKGNVVERFHPKTAPVDIKSSIEKFL